MGMEGISLKDKYGRTIAVAESDDELVVTATGTGTLNAVMLIKHEVKKQYTGYVKKVELDELNVRTVQIPANFAGLEAVDVPTRLRDQFFEIYDIDEQDEYVEISARHIFYRNLKNYTLWKPTEDTEYTAAAVCRNVMTNAMFDAKFDVASDCTDKLPGKDFDYERKNLVECFLDPENGICAKFGLSLIRDNNFFYCLKDVGYDRGYLIQDGKNLLGVDRHENLDGVATRVAAYGKDSKGEIVWMNHNGLKYIDSQYIDSYEQPMLEIYETDLQIGKDGVTADNIQSKLLEAAQKRFSEDKVDLPEVTMTVEFISLGDTEEYVQYRGLDKVYLYDILTIKDSRRGYNYSAQVIGVEHDVLTGRLLSVTIGSLQQADAKRKIASWQVPEVDGSNIRLLSLQAGVFAPGSINTRDLAPRIITADYIESGEIITRHLAAEAVTADKIEAGAITAGKIAAGAITTEKLDAYAVTTTKLAAEAVTAEKIKAGEVTASKISANFFQADNVVAGVATIANARIANADINFAHIKDLNAESAYFEQAIFDEAVGGKLYVPRLAVGYAQMIGATIGDLVIQASNGNFYGIDVDLNGNVTATQRTVSAGEIAAGHTSDGRTLVLGTDILATDLNTQNIYASHALMNEITAATISVDELWARTAFIGHLMTTDISSNTYIQATIGNWQSGSTITQTINSLDSRISSLGYGTVYFQADEPSHAELVAGDIWIQSTSTGTWNTVLADYATWQTIKDTVGTWQTVGGIPKMWVWDGRFWQEMYDALLPITLETEIQQLADAISLRATKAEVDVLANDVTEFSAQITIMADEIESAVSAVNLKAASYVMLADPRTAYTVSVGDIWIKYDSVKSWTDVSTTYATWTEVKTKYDIWQDLLASQTFVWNGSEWVETSDRASEIHQKTVIDQTINQVTILAEASAQMSGDLITTQAQLRVTNSSIEQEVLRATTAEGGKLDKTSQYQTADSIVAEAERWSAANLLAKTSSYQTADAIVSEAVRQSGVNASSAYIAKTTQYQSASAIVNTAVTQAGTNANNNFIKKSGSYTSVNAILAEAETMAAQAENDAKGACIAKTVAYQTADAIVTAATTYTDGKLTDYSTTAQTSSMIAAYVGNNAYGIISGIQITAAGIDISGSQYVKIASGGYLDVRTGDFGIATNGKDNSDYVIWSGASSAANSSFRVKKNGEVTLTKLLIVGEDNTETEVNLRTYGLWKLNYHTVKSYATNSITLSNGATVNFNTAASVTLTGGWSGNTFTVINSGNAQTSSAEVAFVSTLSSIAAYLFTASNHTATMSVRDANRGNTVLTEEYNATALYNAVVTNARAEGAAGVTVDSVDVVQTSRNGKKKYYVALTATASNNATKNRTIEVDAEASYNDGWNDALAACGISGGGTVFTGSVRQLYDRDLDVYVNAVNPYTAYFVQAK